MPGRRLSCVDLEHTANAYRFYGLVASGCTIGLNLAKTKSGEFYGAGVFGNSNVDVSVTGTRGSAGPFILFDGLHMGHSGNANMYVDQQNETVLCAANCFFSEAGESTTCTPSTDCDAALAIGPDAYTGSGQTPVIAQFNQGAFAVDVHNDIYFDTNSHGKPCHCRVALGGGMLDVTSGGQATTNNAALVSGDTSYAPPTFANAASVGVPLTLAPAELGIGVSAGTGSNPNGPGLKLRVECSTQTGKAKLVAVAGTVETVVKDPIGASVPGC